MDSGAQGGSSYDHPGETEIFLEAERRGEMKKILRVKGRERDWNRKAFDGGRMEERIGADIGYLVAEQNGREKLKLKQAGVELT